jgi:hypothetical protein
VDDVFFVMCGKAVIGAVSVTIQMRDRDHVHPISSAASDVRNEAATAARDMTVELAPGHSRETDCRAGVRVGNGASGGACARPFAGPGRILLETELHKLRETP